MNSLAIFNYTYDGTNRRSGQTATDNSRRPYPSATPSVSYTSNSLNQYSAVGPVTPTCDGNGNLTFDGMFTYCYDAESRLTGILSSGSCASPGAAVASYAYDAQGRRKSKTVGSTTTVYVTDADNREVVEYDGGSGAVGNWYGYGLGPDGVLNQMNVAGATRETMVPDIQGSVIATLDAASGRLSKAAYLAFGENATSYSGTFRYTGQRIDPETGGSPAQPSGLYDDRARIYSPGWGRFLQADPVGYAAGVNLYAYVGNDPLNATDPQGLCYPACTVAGGAIIGGVVGGGYYLFTAPHPSFAGFLANTAAGAVVGGTAGSGAGIAVLLGVGAGSNAVAQVVTAAADNNLGRYGSTTLQNTAVVLGDAAVGAAGALGGKIAGDIAAPYISSGSNSVAASLFLNSNFRSAADAAVINGIDPASQTAGAAGLGVLGNTLQDAAQGLYQNPTGSQAPGK